MQLVQLAIFGSCFGNQNYLTDVLMGSYDSKTRPSTRYTKSVDVHFKIHFNQLLDVNEVRQKIETKLFISHTWYEPRLRWTPEEFGGVKFVHLPIQDLWFPLLVLYNNADGDFGISQFTKARVNYTGWVVWKPPAIFKSFCKIQVDNFPFDTQNCTLKIGPWSDHENLVDMVNSDGTVLNNYCEDPVLTSYEDNSEWKLLDVGCYKHYVHYNCCSGGDFVDFTYYFVLQRRPLYLIVNILFPTMLFSFLACAVFYLPPDTGEKITLSISVLLSLTVFLLVIVEAIPSTASGTVPLLCQYIVFTMILVCLSIMITVPVLNIHFRGPATHILSDRMKKIFMVWFPKFIFSSTMKRLDPNESTDLRSSTSNPMCTDNEVLSSSSNQSSTNNPRAQLIGNDVRQAADGVNFVAQYLKDSHESQKKEDQWKYVAMVLDHFLLYIFMLICFLGTVIVFGKRLLVEYAAEEEALKSNSHECLLNCQKT